MSSFWPCVTYVPEYTRLLHSTAQIWQLMFRMLPWLLIGAE